jgi:hypothetical protein
VLEKKGVKIISGSKTEKVRGGGKNYITKNFTISSLRHTGPLSC